jgi:hypothetical protein
LFHRGLASARGLVTALWGDDRRHAVDRRLLDPPYEILEARGIEVYLVNARHTKSLPGRKTDVQESQWLLKLHTYGLLRNAFHSPADTRIVRTYWRQRGDHVHAVSTRIQRIQKVLTQMNIQLANVISDMSGWTGQRIVRAMLAGERDPHTLAALSHPGIHATRDTIAKSLEGTWQPDLLFVLQQEVAMYDATLSLIPIDVGPDGRRVPPGARRVLTAPTRGDLANVSTSAPGRSMLRKGKKRATSLPAITPRRRNAQNCEESAHVPSIRASGCTRR